MEITSEELRCIKDKAKRLMLQKQIKMNSVISQAIAQNTLMNKLTKTKLSKLTSLLKNDSLYQGLVTPNNQNLLNKMPYILFGVVESVFVDEDKSENLSIKKFYLIDNKTNMVIGVFAVKIYGEEDLTYEFSDVYVLRDEEN